MMVACHATAWHGFDHGEQVEGWQGLALVLVGVVKFQGCREGQGWTKSNVKFQHGLHFSPCLPGVCGNARKKENFEF